MNGLLAPQGAAPPAPPQGAPPQLDPAQLAEAKSHVDVVLKGLMGLAAKPRGALSKRDVFNAAADMIADGGFGSPEAKQQLIAEIANMPDDEGAIRQAIGGHILRLAQARDVINRHSGAA